MPRESRHICRAVAYLLVLGACTPLRDLDAAGAGDPGLAKDRSTAAGSAGQGIVGATSNIGGLGNKGNPGGTGGGVQSGGGLATAKFPEQNATTPGSGGASALGTVAIGGAIASLGSVAPELREPRDPPVTGEIGYSDGATWVIDEVERPTVEVHTPVASYWLVKDAAAFVSIQDTSERQWINYHATRRRRGLPSLGVCCQLEPPSGTTLPAMTTEVDLNSRTGSHLRLVSRSISGDVHVTWDFFLTHVTITLNRLPVPYGFTYRGVPGGTLDSTDELRLSDGSARSASNVWYGDLPGPAEWVYFADVTVGQSMFLVRHGDDNLEESYVVADSDSAQFNFADGKDQVLPLRFSVGLIKSTDHATVKERVDFVINAVQ